MLLAFNWEIKSLQVDGRPTSWWKFQSALVSFGRAEDGRPVVQLNVLRNGQEMEFKVHPDWYPCGKVRYLGIHPETDEFSGPIVLGLIEDMAESAGLLPGDRILKFDEDPVVSGNVLSSCHIEKRGFPEISTVERRVASSWSYRYAQKWLPIRTESAARNLAYHDLEYKTEIVHYHPIEQLYSHDDAADSLRTASPQFRCTPE